MTTTCPGRPWSCDTFAVKASHSSLGGTILGKNSDRPTREAQPLRYLPARRAHDRLRLAYLEIDDIAETIPHLGSSPYWCWGHEFGLNAHGVAIGNEAIFTRDLAVNQARHRNGERVEPGILGMELLRLALERADSARAAVEVMTDLVERYGQWGAGTRSQDLATAAYDNSYLIADPNDIWVLETTGRRWAAKAVDEPTWALSNEPTLRDDWTRSAGDLAEWAQSNGWPAAGERLDFASAVTDPAVPLQVSHIRLQRSRSLLRGFLQDGPIGFTEARRVLSDHYEGSFLQGPKFNPARPDFLTLCMHQSTAGFTWGNTAASTITVLPQGGTPVMWWAPVTPCTSLYLPVVVHQNGVPPLLATPGTARGTGPNPEHAEEDRYAEDSMWWRFQRLLELVAGDEHGSAYHDRQRIVRAAFDALQTEFLDEAQTLSGQDAATAHWTALTESCVQRACAAADQLLGKFS
ncbi:MAG TPA: C69 family dipeptidase [Nocardioidaceae bacterium]|nr:C69 family dipeptidase [Nocardioidaceae bacterium]